MGRSVPAPTLALRLDRPTANRDDDDDPEPDNTAPPDGAAWGRTRQEIDPAPSSRLTQTL
ncbi:MAG: hypothetical protein ACK5CA_01220 [Cyanobacteriota bacterium]